jgi:hypothetical protein
MPRGTIKNSANGNIGDVRYARLSEAQFQSINGPGWVLYDNRSVVGSALHAAYGTATLHDHRGCYPRAKLNGRVFIPALSDLALGTFEDDAMQDHTHRTTLHADTFDGGDGESMDNDTSGSTSTAPWQSNNQSSGRTNSAETKVKTGILNAFIKINH